MRNAILRRPAVDLDDANVELSLLRRFLYSDACFSLGLAVLVSLFVVCGVAFQQWMFNKPALRVFASPYLWGMAACLGLMMFTASLLSRITSGRTKTVITVLVASLVAWYMIEVIMPKFNDLFQQFGWPILF